MMAKMIIHFAYQWPPRLQALALGTQHGLLEICEMPSPGKFLDSPGITETLYAYGKVTQL